MSAFDLAGVIARGEASAEDAVRASLGRIAAGDGAVRAFIETFPDRALDAARAVDARRARGEAAGPLAGVPVAVKDNLCLEWGRTTCASRMLEHYRSPYTATAVRRLIDAGAVVVGKTNLDEFAMGSSTERSAFFATRNPRDPGRVPGGSSGGSAAAVAAGMTPAALGSDTGGSVRQPASMCGVVGFKPTYGRVSRYGLVAFASSLDQVGPLTRDVRDAAVVTAAMAGRDPCDATSADAPAAGWAERLDEPPAGLRLGVPREVRSPQNHPAVNFAFERAVMKFRDAGAEIVEIDLPHLRHGIAAYYIVALAEASSNLGRYDGIRYGRRAELRPGEGLAELYARSRAEGFGPEVRRRILLGTHVLSSGYYDAYYLTALKVRRLIKGDFDRALGPRSADGRAGGCHAVLMPTTPGPAWKFGEKSADPLAMYLEDVYTVTANLAGIPAISVPMGEAEEEGSRLPLGLQILGPAFEDLRVLRIARMWEHLRG
ncbi:MAG: Asp-tRNA(Asn)/Glu-tRNA(Gln) amidotransferase subunit GatA [Phycisphaerales bacterium]|nr:Asp-tRNA(Asn)/Glu-tRNA(Gln) amidotransferase subunit GatA [Phycisphaerales bacterium]